MVVPGAGEGVAVLAEGAPVVRRGALLPSPDREGVPLKLVDVVEGVAHVAVEARCQKCQKSPKYPSDTFGTSSP
jgi:hypothetical protein